MVNQLRGNDLRKLGFPAGPVIGRALDVLAQKEFRKMDKGSTLALLKQIKDDPFKYVAYATKTGAWWPSRAPALARGGPKRGN